MLVFCLEMRKNLYPVEQSIVAYACPLRYCVFQLKTFDIDPLSHSAGEKPYQCKTCDRSFASSSTLTTHMRIHTGEKPYSCTVCDRRFVVETVVFELVLISVIFSFARYDLTVHMRTHTGEKPYVCSTCPKRFTTSGQLNQHSRN